MIGRLPNITKLMNIVSPSKVTVRSGLGSSRLCSKAIMALMKKGSYSFLEHKMFTMAVASFFESPSVLYNVISSSYSYFG